MEKFSKIYPNLKPSIVAIASRVSKNPELPDIIGTGFIARSDGIIFTNDHVIKAVNKLPRLKSMGQKIGLLLFYTFTGSPIKE